MILLSSNILTTLSKVPIIRESFAVEREWYEVLLQFIVIFVTLAVVLGVPAFIIYFLYRSYKSNKEYHLDMEKRLDDIEKKIDEIKSDNE